MIRRVKGFTIELTGPSGLKGLPCLYCIAQGKGILNTRFLGFIGFKLLMDYILHEAIYLLYT